MEFLLAQRIEKMISEKKRYSLIVLVVLFILMPQVITNSYYLHILNLLGIYIILSLSLDLTVGTTGELQLGQAGFFGFGAYLGALISVKLMPNLWYAYWVAIPVVAVGTMLVGLMVGAPTLRLKGIYFALATLGFGEIMRIILLNWEAVTMGSLGVKNIPAPFIFSFELGSREFSFYIIWLFVAACTWIIYSLRKSRFGRYWRAIREDDVVASTLGIDIFKSKIWALMISAGIAGVAGTIFAHYISYIHPSNFTLDESVLVLSMIIIGGRDLMLGPFVGATLLVLLPEVLRPVAQYRLLIYGVILTVMVIYKPEGVLGKKWK